MILTRNFLFEPPPNISKSSRLAFTLIAMSSSNEFVKSTAILTEHLGYAPIALIDDVINAVNEILYKCTNAMESFLALRYPPNATTTAPEDATTTSGNDLESDEIELGTAKLETYLESVVDKSFDKYELYVLRNIFVIPFDLISEGWIRLGHHRNVNFVKPDSEASKRPESSPQLISLYEQISQQKRANLMLRAHTRRTEKLLSSLELYSANFVIPPSGFVSGESSTTGEIPESIKQTYKEISPITETISFLASQVQAITEKANQIHEMMNSSENTLNDTMTASQASLERDLFVNALSKRAVDIAGLNSSSDFVKIISKNSQYDAERLAQALGGDADSP